MVRDGKGEGFSSRIEVRIGISQKISHDVAA